MKPIVTTLLFILSTQVFSQDLVPYRDQKRWGFADQNGKIIIEPQYEKAWPFMKNGLAKVKNENGLILINSKNEVKTTQAYTEIFEFKNGLAAVCIGGEYSVMQGEIVGGKWGYINEKDCALTIPANFSRAQDFNGNYAIVQTNGNWGNWGLIDKTGKTIFPFKYPSYSFDMRPFPGIQWFETSNKLEVDVSGTGEKWQMMDVQGNKISAPVAGLHGTSYSKPSLTEQTLKKAETTKEAKIQKENYIIKTPTGNYTSSGDVTAIENNLYVADIIDENKKNKFGIIDENNNIIIPFIYDYIDTKISEGLLIVVKDKRYGFCDLKGNEVIPCRYALANNFKNGLARVYLSVNDYSVSSTGYINKTGKEFFKSDPVYQVITKNNKKIITDQYYNPVKLDDEDEYDQITILNNSRFLATKLNTAKLFDAQGHKIAEGNFIQPYTNELVLISRTGNQQLFNIKTNQTIIDSIHHITSKVSHPKTLNLFGYTFVDHKNNFGLFTISNKALIPAKYNAIQFTGNYLILQNNKNQYAICDTNNVLIKEFSGDNISYVSGNLFSVQNKTLNEIFDARTKSISNFKIKKSKYVNYVYSGSFENAKGLLGYINPITEEILNPVYVQQLPIKMFDENFIPVELIRFKKANGLYDIYNTQTGKIIIQDCETTETVQGRYLPVKVNGKFYFYDNNGSKLFETAYDEIRSVYAFGYTAVKQAGKWGLIDRENNAVINFKYDDITNVIDNLVMYALNRKYGVLDMNDSVLINAQYQSIEYISTQLNDTMPAVYYFLAEKEGKKGIINQSNQIITPFEMEGESDFPFNDDVFIIYKNGKPVLFNNQGKIVLSGDFDNIKPFEMYDTEGHEFVLVSKGKKVGLYTITGKQILDCSFDKINAFEGYYDPKDRLYFSAKKGNKHALICNTGEILMDPVMESFDVFYVDETSYQRIKQNGKYGLYRNFRKKLTNYIYDDISFDEETIARNIFIFKRNGKFGVLDSTGKTILEPIYSKISSYSFDGDNFYLEIIIEGKKGLADENGKIIVPPNFTKIEPIYDIDNLGFFTYDGKLLGIYSFEGKMILENKFIRKDYSDDDQYMLIFFTKDNERWGLTPTFDVVKL